MSTGFFKVPKAKNEIVKSYRPGSPERKEVIEMLWKVCLIDNLISGV